MTTLLLTALLTCAAEPTGLAPTMMVLQVKDKALVSERKVTVDKAVPHKVTKVVEGKTVEETVTKVVKEEVKTTSASYPIEGATFQTAGGKKLDPAEALKKLATPTLVVVSADGRPVDEGFLAALKPGTLVVVVPSPSGITPVAPAMIRPILRIAPKDAPVKDK
ncbi:MAG: hypothetical protein ACRC33_05565 [Gemmataceae bacterium]